MSNEIVHSEAEHRTIRETAKLAALSQFYAAKTESACFTIIMTGLELGLKPMQSLRGIDLIEGKPALRADTMLAIVLGSGKCERWEVISSSSEECVIETQRKGCKPVRCAWTWAMAERAKLTGKNNWKSYPDTMLRHRCVASLARQVYPDVVMGLYTKEELESSGFIVQVEPQTEEPHNQLEEPSAVTVTADWLQRIQSDLRGATKGVPVLCRYAEEISRTADITVLPTQEFVSAARGYLEKAPDEQRLQEAINKIKASATREFADAVRPELDKLAIELRAKYARAA